jgi:hypothetical protein
MITVQLICTEMSGNGRQTGMVPLIPPATRWWTQQVRHRARIGSHGVVPGPATVRSCVLLSAATPPPATVTTALASVLVSKSNSKGAMYGRMTGMAEREGGAGRAWTKGATAQKGHARHAEPRRKFASSSTVFIPCHREG